MTFLEIVQTADTPLLLLLPTDAASAFLVVGGIEEQEEKEEEGGVVAVVVERFKYPLDSGSVLIAAASCWA